MKKSNKPRSIPIEEFERVISATRKMNFNFNEDFKHGWTCAVDIIEKMIKDGVLSD